MGRSHARRSRWISFRRVWMTAAWFVIVGGLYLGLGVLGGWFVRNHLGEVASIAVPDYDFQTGKVEIGREGFVIEGLRVLEESSGVEIADADRFELGLEFDGFTLPKIRSVIIDGPKVVVTELLLRDDGGEPTTGRSDKPLNFDWLKVDRVRIREGNIAVILPGMPTMAFDFEFEADDLDGSRPGDLSTFPQTLAIRNLHMRNPATDEQVALVGRIEAKAHVASDLLAGRVESLEIENPDLLVTPSVLEMFVGSDERSDEDGPRIGPWTIEQLAVIDGSLRIDDFENYSGLSLPDVEVPVMSGTISGLHYENGTVTSSELQKIRLEALRVDAGDGTETAEPLANAVAVDAEFVLDDFLDDGWVEKLAIEAPTLSVGADRLARYLRGGPTTARSDASDPPTATEQDEPFPAVKIRSFDITNGFAAFDPAGLMAGLPYGYGHFTLKTVEQGEDPHYEVEMTDVRGRVFEAKTRPFMKGKRVSASFSALGLQQGNRLDSVEFSGWSARVGEDVERLMSRMENAEKEESPDSKPDEASARPQAGDEANEPPWTIGRLGLADSAITLEDIIPGLPYVKLNLGTTIDEVRLTGRTEEDRRVQRIELSGLEVAAPYNTSQTVIRLPTVWVHFTVAGLFESEIEKIEILSPELYVGEPLFWYIDYYQRYDSGGAGEAEDTENADVAAADPKPGDPSNIDGTIEALEKVFESATISGWAIKEIEAFAGKILIAPKGEPLGIFPFPFSFRTNIAKRELDLRLEIQEGDYVFDDLRLELLRMKGESFVNYPIRNEDKNFVQTLESKGMRFQQIKADDITLSVTYDAGGIYGKLWAGAYGGDLNAEFNIYIGKEYAWDAWASAVGFELGPFFEALAPDRFVMTGTLDGKLIANGVELSVDKAYGELKTGKGSMHIKALDAVLASLPDSLDVIQEALTKASIDVFRNYDFDEGEARLDMEGREGGASIVMDGPDGKREIGFSFHDETDAARERRARETGKKVSQVASAAR